MEAAAQASDLIGVVTHGWGGFTRLLRASVADQLGYAARHIASLVELSGTHLLGRQSSERGFLLPPKERGGHVAALSVPPLHCRLWAIRAAQ